MLSKPCPAGKSLPPSRPLPGNPEPKFPPPCRQGTHRCGDMSATVGARHPQLCLLLPRAELSPKAESRSPGVGSSSLAHHPKHISRAFCHPAPLSVPSPRVLPIPHPRGGCAGSRWRQGTPRGCPRCPRRAEPRGRCLAPIAGLEEERGGRSGAGESGAHRRRKSAAAAVPSEQHRAGSGPWDGHRGHRGGHCVTPSCRPDGAGVTHRRKPSSLTAPLPLG